MYGACKMAYFILCIFAPEFYLAAAVVGVRTLVCIQADMFLFERLI